MIKSEISWPGPKYLENLVVVPGQKKVGKHCPRALRARGFYQFLQKQARFRCKTEGKNLEVNFSKFQGISILTRSCWNHPLHGSSNMGRYAAPTRFHGSMAMAFPSRWFYGYGYCLAWLTMPGQIIACFVNEGFTKLHILLLINNTSFVINSLSLFLQASFWSFLFYYK